MHREKPSWATQGWWKRRGWKLMEASEGRAVWSSWLTAQTQLADCLVGCSGAWPPHPTFTTRLVITGCYTTPPALHPKNSSDYKVFLLHFYCPTNSIVHPMSCMKTGRGEKGEKDTTPLGGGFRGMVPRKKILNISYLKASIWCILREESSRNYKTVGMYNKVCIYIWSHYAI